MIFGSCRPWTSDLWTARLSLTLWAILLAIGHKISIAYRLFFLSIFCCFPQHVQQNKVGKKTLSVIKASFISFFKTEQIGWMEKGFPNKLVRSKHSALTVTFRMAQLRAWNVQTVSTLKCSALKPQVVDHCYGLCTTWLWQQLQRNLHCELLFLFHPYQACAFDFWDT